MIQETKQNEKDVICEILDFRQGVEPKKQIRTFRNKSSQLHVDSRP
jgi:nitric oxide reductase activation protein